MIFDRAPRRVPGTESRNAGSSRPRVEELEGRALMALATPTIVMDSAMTSDSRGVAFEYDVEGADLGRSITFAIVRSADDRYDASDVGVGSVTETDSGQGTPSLDDDGRPATAEGHHRVTVTLPQGLAPNPEHPYVLIVADPSKTLSGVSEAPDTASFRPYLIGVITHGGLQPKSWRRGVPWALQLAKTLRAEGYDAVIAYNWVPSSHRPGAAAEQGPKLGKAVLHAASRSPADAPVDVHFIGHSEGTVVNSLAIRYLARHETPQLREGFLKDTMLDPHAANNDAPGGKQYSVASGFLGNIAGLAIGNYQGRAKDPLPVVPAIVDQAEVFYQHTPAPDATGSNGGLYNLWGQVPVPVQGDVPIHYYNLTGVGISHAGDYSVPDWYRRHVAPTLGDGSTFTDPTLLNGGTDADGSGSAPEFHGEAEPGARVRVFATAGGSSDHLPVGETVAGADGDWTLRGRPLPAGTYRVSAQAVAGADPAWPHVLVTPRAFLGTIRVPARHRPR